MVFLSNLVNESLHNNKNFFIQQLGNHIKYNTAYILENIDQLSSKLENSCISITNMVIGIAMQPSIQWVISDLMCLIKGAISLPIPLEFSDEQISNLLINADYCLINDTNIAIKINKLLPDIVIISIDGNILYNKNNRFTPKWPNLRQESIIKIVHTSGTTSTPKGVKVTNQSLGLLIQTLVDLHKHLVHGIDYLSIISLSLLIEQVLGLYLPLVTDGSLTLIPKELPIFGSQINKSQEYLELFKLTKVNFAYMPPRLLEEMILLSKHKDIPPSNFFLDKIPHIITGGAKINPQIINELEIYGIKVYEAYGLSETSSIVSLNIVGERKTGSAGKILPYIDYKLENNELCIKGPTLSPGYLVKDSTSCNLDESGYLKTGDLVELTADGFLQITGRIKNLIILSNARNVSPEWVEYMLKENHCISDVIIIGEGKEYLTALVILSSNTIEKSQITKAIDATNNKLPDFCKIQEYFIITAPNSFRKKYYTVTGRPKRDLISRDYLQHKVY
jgi:long-chain acyl-CoA synthetase